MFAPAYLAKCDECGKVELTPALPVEGRPDLVQPLNPPGWTFEVPQIIVVGQAPPQPKHRCALCTAKHAPKVVP